MPPAPPTPSLPDTPGRPAASRRPKASLPIDVGLIVFLVAVVIVVVLGRSHLRPFDAPEIDPRPILLPLYLVRSLARLVLAYAFAVTLALAVGHLAARSPVARRIILPTLDVLQSVPILGFFPAAVAVFIGILGESALGVEAAAVFLIFTSMFWNLAFSVYETLITLPEELVLASRQFGLRGPLAWTRFVLPAVAPNLLYNSILSWSNGWYFLIASEIIAAGPARYTLPGLGSYLAQAIEQGRNDQMAMALLALVVVVVGMHLLVWSPLETWAERFQMGETGNRPRVPRMGRLLARSRLVRWFARWVMAPFAQWAFRAWGRLLDLPGRLSTTLAVLAAAAFAAGVAYAAWRASEFVFSRPLAPVAREIPWTLFLSFLRVTTGVGLAVVLSIPLAFVTFRRTRVRQTVLSILQILGSIPATAFFPLIAVVMLRLRLGMDVAAVLLVLTGTFFYVAFNVLSGAASIPKEMNEAAEALGLRRRDYLRRVFVPAVLPSLVTGCVTAWGGGWNAIIFSEYVVAGGRSYEVRGIGATLDRATYVTGDLQVVTLSLVSMVALVVLINRVFWDPLYQHVAERYRLEA
jgi:NitT/TauT family transport system permease protein